MRQRANILLIAALLIGLVLFSGCINWTYREGKEVIDKGKKGYSTIKEEGFGALLGGEDALDFGGGERIEHACGDDVSCIRSALASKTKKSASCSTSAELANARLKSGYTAVCITDEPCYYCCTGASCTKDICGTHEKPLSDIKISDVSCLEML